MAGHEVGEQRLHGGREERPRDPEHEKYDEHRPHGARPGEHEGEEARRAGRLDADAGGHDAAPVEPVGRGPGDENEDQGRRELHEADEAEQKRIARLVIELPADRHRHDLDRERGEEACRPVEREASVAERGGRSLPGDVGVHVHYLFLRYIDVRGESTIV